MITRITFIEPKNDHLHIFSRFELPRLGSILLATIMRDRGYQTESLYMQRAEILSSRVDTDLVALSTITSTTPAAYEVADAFRRRGVPVVIGGPHVSFLPDEALDHADFVIAGEAEKSFPLLVEALNHDGRLEDVPGLSWKEKGVTRHNQPASPIEDLDSLPFPDFSLLRLGARGKLAGPGGGKATVPVQTSRGCPYDCSFCSVTGMFGHRYRHRSTASVVAELAQYDADKCFIFFYDDNFAANPAKTKDLLREMIRLGLGLQWSTQVRTDVAKDPELLDLMAAAGCATLFIGLES
ncbi:MAG TPA: radical SAM protein, partial [Spirochaetia bacterium]